MDQMSETSFRAKPGKAEAGSEAKAPLGGKPPHAASRRGPMVRKARGQGASRRGEILDAAKRLFIEEGFANATMRRIAAEVGVSPTALYLHFADKEAILQAIADDYFSELLVVLNKTQGHEAPSLARMRAGLRAYVMFGLSRYDEYRLTFENRAARNDPSVCPDSDVASMSFCMLQSSVEKLVAAGDFPQRRSSGDCGDDLGVHARIDLGPGEFDRACADPARHADRVSDRQRDYGFGLPPERLLKPRRRYQNKAL